MNSAFTYTSGDLAQAREWSCFQLQTWGIDSGYVDWFLAEGARLLGEERTGRVVLDYDPQHRLLSFDIWCDDERLYGIDDFV